MGQQLMGASFANSEGHFEDLPLVELHDEILAANNTDWRECSSLSLETPNRLADRLETYLQERLRVSKGPVGAKDPRALFFKNAWFNQNIVKVKALFVFRDWQYSVSSLLKRHSRELIQSPGKMGTRPLDLGFWKIPDLAANMWLTSANAMLNWLQSAPRDTLVFPLHALIDENSQLIESADRCNIPIELFTADKTLNKGLLHKTIPASLLSMISPTMQEKCNNALQQLYKCSGFEPKEKIVFTDSESKWELAEFTGVIQNVSIPSESVELHLDLDGLDIEEALDVIEDHSDSRIQIKWASLLDKSIIAPTTYDRIYHLALSHGQTDVAVLAIKRAIGLQPASWRLMYLGDLLKNRGLIKDAKEKYTEARTRAPNNASFYARLAEIAILEGEQHQARKLLSQARNLDPSKPAIAIAESKFSQHFPEIKDHTDKPKRAQFRVMRVVENYSEVVIEMSTNRASGIALDRYMVKTAFILRDNREWLEDGIQALPEQSKQCLLDYLWLHAKQAWPELILRTEFGSCEARRKLRTPHLPLFTSVNSIKIGVHIHVYYPELLPEIYAFLSNIKCKVHTIVTCAASVKAEVDRRLACQPYTQVICVENCGRDIAPWLMVAAKKLRNCDFVLKLHTKSTPHANKLSGWRLQLLWSLIGDADQLSRNIEHLIENKNTGILMPEYHPHIFPHVNWGENKTQVMELANKLNINVSEHVAPFPAGSMFWYRPEALGSLLDHNWNIDLFEKECGQTDGTIMHAIERIIPFALADGYKIQFTSLANTLQN